MNNSKKRVVLLALPVLVLTAWALQLQGRSKTPALEIQQVTVRALPVSGQAKGHEKPDTQVNLTVKFTDPRPFWQRGTTSWSCEVGYIWWVDERGRRHETTHQTAGSLTALGHQKYLVTYECMMRAAPIPPSAAQVRIEARVIVNEEHVLPVSVVTHRKEGSRLQIVK